jgi:dihydrofolate reductase
MNLIAAVSADWGLGCNNNLLFHIKEDLARFKQLTLSKVVIMGHNTFKSLPESRKPLPHRVNIVLSHTEIPGVLNCTSEAELEIVLKNYDPKDVFVIGGEKIYNLLLNRCERAYITKVEACPPADVFMPNLDELPNWRLHEETRTKKTNGFTYKFCTYANLTIS